MISVKPFNLNLGAIIINTIILEGIKHAERRLNEIPHRYKDTNFKLISEASKQAEEMLQGKSKRRQSLLAEVLQLREAITKMRDIYEEKRSDVSEMCDAILSGQEPKESDPES